MDLISLRELQESCLKQDLPFVSYRMPGSTIPVTYISEQQHPYISERLLPNISGVESPFLSEHQMIFQYEKSSAKRKKGFIISPFDKKLPSVWINADLILSGYHFDKMQFKSYTVTNSSIPLRPLPSPPTKHEYLGQVNTILNEIHSNLVNKVVLSRNLRITFDKNSESPLLFNNLSSILPNAFVYLINVPEIGCWLGATPELLLSANSECLNENSNSSSTDKTFLIKTMALAGTRSLGSNEKWNIKEIEEQEWVSRYIEEALNASGCKEVKRSLTYTSVAGNVEHLRTDFSGKIDLSSLDELINNLHPTPAVCGWPKDKALELILETENYDRSYYCGYLGPVDPKHNLSLFVNLRCMEIHASEASLYVGGGLTSESNPEDEWNETSIKSRTLLSEIEKIQNLAL